MARIVVDELVSVIKPELDRRAAAAAERGLHGIGSEADRASRKAGNLRKRLGNLARRGFRLAATGAAALGTAALAAAAAISKATNDFAKANDELVKTADNLGLTSDAYQELQFAAERSGISASTFDKGIKTFNKNLGDFLATGTGPAAQALEQLGLGFDDLANKTPDEAFAVVADRLQEIDSIQIRTSASSALLGKAGVEFGKLTENGAEGIRQLREEAQRYGAVIGEDVLRESERAVDAQANLDASFKGLTNTILGRFVPGLADSKQAMADFLVENREFIGLGIDRAMEVVGNAISVVSEAFSQVASVIQPFLDGFFSATDIFSIMVDGAFQVIDAIVSLGTAFGDLFGITDETLGDIGEIVGTVIGTGVQTIFDFFSDTILRLAELIGDLGDSFDFFAEGNFLDGIKHIGRSLVDFLLEPIRFIVRELVDLADVIDSDLVPQALRNFAQGGGVAQARRDNSASRKARDQKTADERASKERASKQKQTDRENKRKEEREQRENANTPSSRAAARANETRLAKAAGDAEFQRQKARGVSDARALELAARAEAKASGGRGGKGGKKDAFTQLVQSKIDEQVKQAELAAGASGGNAKAAGRNLRRELSGLAQQGDFSRFGIDPTALAGGAAQAGVGPGSTTPVNLTVNNFNIGAGAITGGINIAVDQLDQQAIGVLSQVIQPIARQLQIATELRQQPRVQ